MNYLTQYYKNLCEQLEKRVNYLSKLLNEENSKHRITKTLKEDLTTDESEIDHIEKLTDVKQKFVDIARPIADAIGGTKEHETAVMNAIYSGDFSNFPRQHHKNLKKLQKLIGTINDMNKAQHERREDPTNIFGAGQKLVGTTGREEQTRLERRPISTETDRMNPEATHSIARQRILNKKI
jgi:hypothetical protein